VTLDKRLRWVKATKPCISGIKYREGKKVVAGFHDCLSESVEYTTRILSDFEKKVRTIAISL